MRTARRTLLVVIALLLMGQATTPTPGPTPAASAAQPTMAGGAVVAVIPVRGIIHPYVFDSLKARTEQALAQGATLIVYELDTYGGWVPSALDISKYLKTLPRPTLAWVNNKAYSAGILIAAACNQIVMSPASAAGDCAPIAPGMNLSPTERAKQLSPILAEFADSARRGGYDQAMFHAMCELGVEVFLVQQRDTGVRRLVHQSDRKVMVEGVAMSDAAAPPVAPELASDADRGQWTLVRQVHNGASLLTLHQDQAFELGLSRNDPATQPIASEADLKAFLNAGDLRRFEQHWILPVAYFLSLSVVRAVLIAVFFIGAYLEAQAPGATLPGLLAGLSLLVLIGAPFLVGLAEVWHLIVFALGLVLLLIEVFVTPGFGVLGAGGMVAMFVGLVLMVVPTTGQGFMPLPAAGTGEALRASVFWSLLGLIPAGVAFYFITRYFGQVPFFNRLILSNPPPMTAPTADGGTVTLVPPQQHLSGEEVIAGGAVRVGQSGRAVSTLRPSGRAEFDGCVVDVVALARWVEPGRPLRVVEVRGNQIVVEEA